MKRKIPVHVWESCYDKQLKGFIVPEAFSHPAKYSLGLIERIFDYCLERGYLWRSGWVIVTREIQQTITKEILCTQDKLNQGNVEEKPPSSNPENPRPQNCQSALLQSESSALTESERGSKSQSPMNGCCGQSGTGYSILDQSLKVSSSTISTKTNWTTELKTSPSSSEQGIQPATESNFKKHAPDKSTRSKMSNAVDARLCSKEKSSTPTACVPGADSLPGAQQSIVTSSGYEVTGIPELGSEVYRHSSVVGDAFGGVAIGGLVAAYRGLHWVGVELEPKFVGLCQQNIALHKSKLAALGRPLPKIIQGDSRKFHEFVQAAAVVSSPPYADGCQGQGTDPHPERAEGFRYTKSAEQGNNFRNGYSESPGQIGRLKAGEVAGVISSPPYNKPFSQEHPGTAGGQRGQNGEKGAFVVYGATEGQIEGLKNGEVQAVISSPPYSDIAAGAGGLNTKPASKPGQQAGRSATAASQDTDQRYGHSDGQISQLKGGSVEAVVSSPPFRDARSDTTKAGATKGGGPCAERLHSVQAGTTYGESHGQIDNLKTGDVHAVVSSPPWEDNSEGSRKSKKFKDPAAVLKCNRGHGASDAAVLAQAARDEQKTYGDSPGQIGKEKGETYWEAMKSVYESCFLAIRPNGVLVLVLKDYVSKGKRVPLCDDTCRLLEHLGFTIIERIHAMLVKETTHGDLFNGHTVTKTERKSFFRRLHEKKPGAVKIDWEEVIFARRPL